MDRSVEDSGFPRAIDGDDNLIDVMTTPSAELVASVDSFPDRVVVLGAGGKMGPTLCIRLARAAAAAGRSLEVVAVSRFSDDEAAASLEAHGVRLCRSDLLDPDSWDDLPGADLVYYLVGQKFGTSSAPHRTWSTNTVVPTYACRRYAGARFVALSTGNVYAMTTPGSGGSKETDALHPVGEYAASCVGRERVFEHFAAAGTIAGVVLIRLNYAVDLRYGVLMDIASRLAANEPIDLTAGYFNCIWQGDANDVILRSADLLGKEHSATADALNVTGARVVGVREVASSLADALGVEPVFSGSEQNTALLSNASRMVARYGQPRVPLSQMISWTAGWLTAGGTVWDKPTHFETRDGKY